MSQNVSIHKSARIFAFIPTPVSDLCCVSASLPCSPQCSLLTFHLHLGGTSPESLGVHVLPNRHDKNGKMYAEQHKQKYNHSPKMRKQRLTMAHEQWAIRVPAPNFPISKAAIPLVHVVVGIGKVRAQPKCHKPDQHVETDMNGRSPSYIVRSEAACHELGTAYNGDR
jgi:hypothetical protein